MAAPARHVALVVETFVAPAVYSADEQRAGCVALLREDFFTVFKKIWRLETFLRESKGRRLL